MSRTLCSIVSRSPSLSCVAGAALLLGTGVAQDSQLRARDSAEGKVVLDIVATPRLTAMNEFSISDNGAGVAPERLTKLGSGSSDETGKLLLVVDAVNSSFQDVTRSEEAVEAFLKSQQSLPQLTSIVILSDVPPPEPASETSSKSGVTTSLRQRQLFAHRIPASKDPAVLVHALDDYKIGLHRILTSQSGPGQAERVQLSLQALSFLARAETSESGPKVVVWIGSGWPFLSKSNAKSSEQLFDSIVYFSDLIRSARIILYSINPEGVTSQDHSAETEAFLLSSRASSTRANGYAPSVPVQMTPTYYKQFLSGVREPKDSSPNDLTLQVLAYQSGGLVLQQNNDLKAEISQCATDAQRISSYAYDPGGNGSHVTYHSIDVKRLIGAGTVRTRTGYYAR